MVDVTNMASVTNGGEETNGWFGVAPFDISFSFGAVCKSAVGSVNQVVNIMDVAVENLHIGTPAMDLRAPAEADSASNLSLNNSGVSSGHCPPYIQTVAVVPQCFSSTSESASLFKPISLHLSSNCHADHSVYPGC